MRTITTAILLVLLAGPASASISFNIELDLGLLLRKKRPCNPTIGYRFVGEPGQTFYYADEWWLVDDSGYVELIAGPQHRYAGELDQYGFRWVQLPLPKVVAK